MCKQKFYEVERIVDKKIVRGHPHYLVKWKGYPSYENSWLPKENLCCPKLLKEFENSQRRISRRLGPSIRIKRGLRREKESDPKKIIKVEVVRRNGEYIVNCLIRWKRSGDGYARRDSIMTTEEMRYSKYYKLLFDYYEEKLISEISRTSLCSD